MKSEGKSEQKFVAYELLLEVDVVEVVVAELVGVVKVADVGYVLGVMVMKQLLPHFQYVVPEWLAESAGDAINWLGLEAVNVVVMTEVAEVLTVVILAAVAELEVNPLLMTVSTRAVVSVLTEVTKENIYPNWRQLRVLQ